MKDPRVAQMMQALGQAQPVGDALHIVKNLLSGGELSPGMGARFDQQRYQSGCEKLLNMVPLPTGGITKRPGFEFLGYAGNSSSAYPARLVPFVFSASESRMLEFSGSASGVDMHVWTSAGKSLGRQLTLSWQAGWLVDVTFCQSADVIFCASPHFAPCKIMRFGDTSWRHEVINWMPQIQAPTIASLRSEGQEEELKTVWYGYNVTAIDKDTGEESMPSPSLSIQTSPLNSNHYIVVNINPVANAGEYRVYKHSAGVAGFIGRVDAGADRLFFDDRNIAADTLDTPPTHKNPFAEAGNPAIVFLHQQRLGFAASNKKPLTVWMSQAGNFESMAASVPPRSDDAIEATMAATQANRIVWAESDRSGLALGTEGGEWLMQAAEGAAISPTDLSFQPQTYFGSEAGVNVLRAGSSLLYLQRGGQACREFGYSFADDRYQSNDLSLLARHLLRDNQIVSWAWQPEPHGIIWCVLYDGTMAGLTYLREHEVVAWHRHVTNGWVETISAIPGPDGSWQIWLLTFRGSRRCVERLASFYEGEGAASHRDGPDRSTFEARCIPCFGEAQVENGSTFGLVKKINEIKCHVINSSPFRVKVSGQGMNDSQTMTMPTRGAGFARKALWSCNISAGFREAATVELIFDGPDPVTLLGLTASVELSESLGNQK